ncbi:hypothetical protein [Roseovarius arcticus]|uniref:hypothetical protein n=1 Tax=Roseovarius arcticus TaxID=2547404 RepID=UPI00111070E9|nr:hypothetical protein [Roseovarius arcticus]
MGRSSLKNVKEDFHTKRSDLNSAPHPFFRFGGKDDMVLFFLAKAVDIGDELSISTAGCAAHNSDQRLKVLQY